MLDQTLAFPTPKDTRPDRRTSTVPVVLIPGDGVGPEVTSAAKAVFSAACPEIDWIEAQGGGALMETGIATGLVYQDGQELTPDVALHGTAGSTEAFTNRVLATLDGLPPGESRAESAPVLREAKAVRKPAPVQQQQRQFAGVDVFVEWHGDVETLAAVMTSACVIGDFRLSMISNRGMVMWPDGAKHADHVPHWRCRFIVAEGARDAEFEISWLLSVIGERVRWMHVEKLESYDGAPACSRAQGETALQT